MNSAASGAAVCRAPLGVVDGAALFGTRGFLGGFSACDLGRLPPPFAPPPRPFGVGAAASLVCACDLALSPLPLVSPTLPFVTGAAASSVSAFDLVFFAAALRASPAALRGRCGPLGSCSARLSLACPSRNLWIGSGCCYLRPLHIRLSWRLPGRRSLTT